MVLCNLKDYATMSSEKVNAILARLRKLNCNDRRSAERGRVTWMRLFMGEVAKNDTLVQKRMQAWEMHEQRKAYVKEIGQLVAGEVELEEYSKNVYASMAERDSVFRVEMFMTNDEFYAGIYELVDSGALHCINNPEGTQS